MRFERIGYVSTDGLRCEGFLSKCDKSLSPCIIELPTGLRSSFIPGANQKQDEFYTHLDDYLNSCGLSVFHVNRRGAQGYGKDFENKKDYGGREIDDIVQAIARLKEVQVVNNGKLVLYGICSTTLSAMLALERMPEISAGLMISGVFDVPAQLRYELKTGSELKPMFRFLGIRRPEEYISYGRSPIERDLSRIVSPIFVYHGLNDTVSPVDQSRNIVAKLRSQGKEVEYHEEEDFPHTQQASDPYTETGRRLWTKATNFLRRTKIV